MIQKPRSLTALVLGAGLCVTVFGLTGDARTQTQNPNLESLAPGGVLKQPRLSALMLAPGQKGRPKQLFDLMDSDADGKINRQEFNLKRMDAFFVRDADKDQKLTRAEIPGIGDDLFAATDKDGDGSMSGYEFNQADWLAFERFDLNRDGVIDPEEFEGRSADLK